MAYQLDFTLRQHTPILHFQHNQPGATLRATEVKPKLDRFLISMLLKQRAVLFDESNIIEKFRSQPEFQEWLIGNSNKDIVALNYKLSFTCNEGEVWLPLSNVKETLEKEIIQKAPKTRNALLASAFFANNQHFNSKSVSTSKWSEMRFGLLAKEPIQARLICFVPDLLEYIEENIRLFFISNNFGTRQSKGFGSFTIKQINANNVTGDDFGFIKNHIYKAPTIVAAYYRDYKSDMKEKISKVAEAWRYLKAGNSHGRYEKSSLMTYFCGNKEIRWEKRAIKKKLKKDFREEVWEKLTYKTGKNRIAGCNNESEQDEKFQYIRILMGMAEHNEYGVPGRDNSVKITIHDKLSKDEKRKQFAVERFKSPATFKIIDEAILMFLHPIPTLLAKDEQGKDRVFQFELEATIDGQKHEGELVSLTIPTADSLEAFFDAKWRDQNLQPDKVDTNASKESFFKIKKP